MGPKMDYKDVYSQPYLDEEERMTMEALDRAIDNGKIIALSNEERLQLNARWQSFIKFRTKVLKSDEKDSIGFYDSAVETGITRGLEDVVAGRCVEMTPEHLETLLTKFKI